VFVLHFCFSFYLVELFNQWYSNNLLLYILLYNLYNYYFGNDTAVIVVSMYIYNHLYIYVLSIFLTYTLSQSVIATCFANLSSKIIYLNLD